MGINPGTDTPFWPYWRLPHGCHKDEWIQDYLRRHSRFKPTRARIERLLQSIAPVKSLEANVFCQYSPEESSLRAEARDTRVFDYLFEVLRPRVMFIHGASGIAHMEQVFKTALPQGQFRTVTHNGCEVDVITGPHLSRGWSYERVDALGQEIREQCINRRRRRRTPASSGFSRLLLFDVNAKSEAILGEKEVIIKENDHVTSRNT